MEDTQGGSSLICTIGSIAGPDGCLVKLSDAIKKPWPDVPFPITATQPIPAASLEAMA